MSITFVQDREMAGRLAQATAAPRIALDLEAAGFHRYSDQVCLVQVTTPDERTWIVDPLAFDPAPFLAPALEDPGTEVVMHGADFDVRLLHRDLGIQLSGLFDTQIAASLLGESALGLSSLLEKHLGIEVSKKHQRADWAQRPLPDAMIEYAAEDTRHLYRLADLLARRLEACGRVEWAREEFEAQERVRWDEGDEDDPVLKVDGGRDLDPRALARLREALEWRDRIARQRDRAPFRIAGDQALLQAADQRPTSVDELAGIRGISRVLARARGEELLDAFGRVEALPLEALEPYPETGSRGRGRPEPEVRERTSLLKSARNRRAGELGIDRGTLLPNATLEEIARREPNTRRELERVTGVKEWQIEAAGEALLAALASTEEG